MASPTKRAAFHGHKWYSGDAEELSSQLDGWLSLAQKTHCGVKAIVCPHAGYHFCGATAAWSWKQVDGTTIDRVVLLGPSHHVHLSRCALPNRRLVAYETPLGDIPLDTTAIEELRASGSFESLSVRDDEREHSLEMQLPYLWHVMNHARKNFKIVPIVVGHIRGKTEHYAALLSKYFDETSTLFVISSDFCHWGSRFDYTYLPPKKMPVQTINDLIETLDFQAISTIERHDCEGFARHLKETGNTICGQKPISILLELLNKPSARRFKTRVLHYSHSSTIGVEGNCVSYAAIATAD